MVWGKPRLTQDLDLTLLCKKENIQKFIKRLSNIYRLLVEDPVSFISQTSVLKNLTFC